MADINDFIRTQAAKLREGDKPPATRAEWDKRRIDLREKMFAAMGEFPAPPGKLKARFFLHQPGDLDMGEVPAKPCDLEPRIIGTLKRDNYTIEKLVFQSRSNVWVTATAYVPNSKEKVPAVLAVHGHWPMARRDPVVQARCLGLVNLGFFVLAVDAFGAGERFTKPGKGTYHGALYGATLWPVGRTLLGMQVYDNRRAIDYLSGRPEVNGKFGITGASGGGNQSMYAGALDERIAAVVPVCSVGNYQAYLKAACCVCEVLPGALQFTEEGDVLGLVAPRALLVINASQDAIQFSPAEAAKSIERAKGIYKLHDADAKLLHKVFESGHDYNQAMREAMYGWMTLHLKGEGKGDPIGEPAIHVEKPEDLACYPDLKDRPKGFLTPPLFAAATGKAHVASIDRLGPDHKEMWEATSWLMRPNLKELLGGVTVPSKIKVETGKPEQQNNFWHNTFQATVEEGVSVTGIAKAPLKFIRTAHALLLHLEGKEAALKHPVAAALSDKECLLYAPDLRGIGNSKPQGDAIAGAPDHNSAEHAVWIGRPLVGQWTADSSFLLAWLAREYPKEKDRIIVGIGHAGIVALLTAVLFPDRISSVVLIDCPTTWVSETPYAAGTPMGILAPGILKVGDIPQIAGLIAPGRLVISGGATLNGKKLNEKELQDVFAFTSKVYKAMKTPEKITIADEVDWNKIDL